MRKFIAALLSVCLLIGLILPSMVMAEDPLTEIAYDVSNVTLSALVGTPYFTAEYGTDSINDGKYELPSLSQIEYHGVPYGADGKMTSSFYIDIDLEAVYDLDKLSFTWYTTRGVRYLVYGSSDGAVYTQIADQSDTANLITLTESTFAENVKVRYVRIEVLGMANYSGLTGNNYFSFHELDLYGTKVETPKVLTEIDYDVNEITLSAPGTASSVVPWFFPAPAGTTDGSYDIACLNDGKYVNPSFAQIVYVGVPYGADGKLIESFYIDIDLKDVYDLDKLSITWMTNRGVRYFVYGSEDGDAYTQIADQSNTVDGTAFTENEFASNVSARYVRIEVIGMDRHSDGMDGSKNYFVIHELDLYGTKVEEQKVLTEINYDVNDLTLSAPGTASSVVPWFFPAPAGTTDGSYDIACLNDGKYVNPSFAQIVYVGVPYGADGKLTESFYIDIDLKDVYDLDKLSITWMTNRGVRYLVYGSQDGNTYTQIADQSNTADGTVLTENTFVSDISARYVRIEILGVDRHSDGMDGSKNYFVIHELDLYGTRTLEDNTPPEGPENTPPNHSNENNTQTGNSSVVGMAIVLAVAMGTVVIMRKKKFLMM